MRKSRRSLRSAMSAAICAGALSVPLITVAASSSHALACHAFAGTPYVFSGDEIAGEGGRSGCASSTTVMVELKYHRPLQPDYVLDYRSGTYANVTFVPSHSCLVGSRTYYIDTSTGTGGGASSDPRRTVDCG